MFRFCSGFSVALGALVCIGCGGGEELTTYPVSGTVTLNGSPVEGAVITFVPEQDGVGAVGKTDASGKYELTTKRQGDGAVAGVYKVTITKYDRPPEQMQVQEAPASVDVTAEDFDEYASVPNYGEIEAAEAAPGGGPAQNTFPVQYASPETSGLQAVVEAGPNEGLDFDLQG